MRVVTATSARVCVVVVVVHMAHQPIRHAHEEEEARLLHGSISHRSRLINHSLSLYQMRCVCVLFLYHRPPSSRPVVCVLKPSKEEDDGDRGRI